MPAQNQVTPNLGAYVAAVEGQLQTLKNRLDLVAPELGGLVVRSGDLNLRSNSITEAKSVTTSTLVWTKATPGLFGRKYTGGAVGSTLANSIIETSLLPATATGSLSWLVNEWTPYSMIKFRAGMIVGATATPTLTLRILLNGVAIATHVLSPTTTVSGEVEMELAIDATGTSALLISKSQLNGVPSPLVTNASLVVDPTIVNTITFTGQWNAASASNTVTVGFVKAEYLQA